MSMPCKEDGRILKASIDREIIEKRQHLQLLAYSHVVSLVSGHVVSKLKATYLASPCPFALGNQAQCILFIALSMPHGQDWC